MNIVVKLINSSLDWQGIRIMVDGPIWDLSPVWRQADEIISTGNHITIVAYEQNTPVGYILYNVTNQKITMTGISKSVPEESKKEIESSLKAELEKILEARKK